MLVVRYRKNGVLKRISATPVSVFEFLLAQIFSRLFIIIVTQVIIFVSCSWLLDVNVTGSIMLIAVIALLGAFCMICIGLLVACRTKSEEFANGVLDAVSYPMMFLSGVWFSLEGTSPITQQIANLLPLTHIIEAIRQVMLYGAGFSAVIDHLIIILCVAIGCLLLSVWQFRWE